MNEKKQVTSRKQEDFKRLLASECHIGTKNLSYHMKKFVSHKGREGQFIINLEETWQKIKLAARVIAAVKNPADICVVSARTQGQRAVVKFGTYTGAISTSSARWTPGTFTNQMTKKFQEPRILIVTDPRQDQQAIIEASYVNIPCIALCDSDSQLNFVDIPIPCNNRKTESISMIYWLLAREIRILRGQLYKDDEWDQLVDVFYFRDVDDELKKEQEEKLKEQEEKAKQIEQQQEEDDQGGDDSKDEKQDKDKEESGSEKNEDEDW